MEVISEMVEDVVEKRTLILRWRQMSQALLRRPYGGMSRMEERWIRGERE